MMLIKCPECELQASDKAVSCPHCGYPLTPNVAVKKPRASNRKKRLPNGFGQISEIKGKNLRKRFRAMVTTGKTETGRPICKTLKPVAYFATYNEAYDALVTHHKSPYELEKNITIKELYEKWSEEHFKSLTESSIRSTKSIWAYCSTMYDMKVSDVRIRHIKGCMNDANINIKGKERLASSNTKARVKSLFNNLLDYAVEYELADKNYARMFAVPEEISKDAKKVKREHMPFSDLEIDTLWQNVDRKEWVDVILMQCYSGWRPQELGRIKICDVDLNNWTFKGGMKTEAGEDRVVPIHPKIRYIVVARYNEALSLGSKYLLNCTDGRKCASGIKLTYGKYKQRFLEVIKELNLNPKHQSHDPRKHFVTIAKKHNLDEYAIKYIVGHQISDITEKVYTERDPGWLSDEMRKIK